MPSTPIPNRQATLDQLASLTTIERGTLTEEYREQPSPDDHGTVRRGPYFKHQCWERGRNPPANRENAALRNEQLGKIASSVAGQRLPAMVLGDLNATPWSPHFRKLERSAALRDTGRRSGRHPTWPFQFPLLWIPLDHCLVSPEIAVASRTIGNGVGSDHFPIILDIVLPAR